MATRTSTILLFFAIGVTEPALAATKPTTRPSTAPVAAPGQDETRYTYFAITEYLTGTAEEIGKKVNNQSSRLLKRIETIDREIATLEKGQSADTDASIKRMRESPEYQRAYAESMAAEQALKVARESGSAKAKVDASSRYNRAAAALRKLEAAAKGGPGDKDEATRAARLEELRQSRTRFATSLTKAAKWRAHLIQVARNGVRMYAPIHVGSEGLLGRVKVLKVHDAHSADVEYLAPQEEKALGLQEGVPAVEVSFHPTLVRVNGIDTKPMEAGSPATLDRNFVITAEESVKTEVGKKPIYVAEPKDNGIEVLFDHLNALEGLVPDFPPEEIETVQEPGAEEAGADDAPKASQPSDD